MISSATLKKRAPSALGTDGSVRCILTKAQTIPSIGLLRSKVTVSRENIPTTRKIPTTQNRAPVNSVMMFTGTRGPSSNNMGP